MNARGAVQQEIAYNPGPFVGALTSSPAWNRTFSRSMTSPLPIDEMRSSTAAPMQSSILITCNNGNGNDTSKNIRLLSDGAGKEKA